VACPSPVDWLALLVTTVMGIRLKSPVSVPCIVEPLPSGWVFTSAVTSSCMTSPTAQVGSSGFITMVIVVLSVGTRSRISSKVTVTSPLTGSVVTDEGVRGPSGPLAETKLIDLPPTGRELKVSEIARL